AKPITASVSPKSIEADWVYIPEQIFPIIAGAFVAKVGFTNIKFFPPTHPAAAPPPPRRVIRNSAIAECDGCRTDGPASCKSTEFDTVSLSRIARDGTVLDRNHSRAEYAAALPGRKAIGVGTRPISGDGAVGHE